MRMRQLVFSQFLLWPALVWGQSGSAPSERPKICVATVANASTVSADLQRMTERIVKSLKRNKLDAEAMKSSTTMDRRLHPDGDNVEEAEDKSCDYTLLTQIVETRQHPAAPPGRGGGLAVPSVDASDTRPGSTSEPAAREEMEISFALFQGSHHEPLVDTSVFEAGSASVSDSFLPGMDRVANRVSHELKKK